MPYSKRIFCAGMLIISFLEPSYPTYAQVTEILTSQTNSNLIEQKLLGRWELSPLSNQIEKQTHIVIFAPNGNYFELTPHKEAIRFQYSIDVSNQDPQIIIQYGIGVFTGTLTDSQMQFQLTETPISEYSKLRGQVIFKARKISVDINLPTDVTVIEAAEHYQRQANLAKQIQAKSYLSTVNYAQNSYFREHQRFAPDFQTITKYIGGDYRGEFYMYKLFLSDNGYVVNTVAVPKFSNLKSYLGTITLVKVGAGDPYVVQGLCESEKPTSQVSLMPKIVGTKIQCPAGYRFSELQPSAQTSPRSSQMVRAIGSEAKSSLGIINRSQQAFRIENNRFATSINQLDAQFFGRFYKYDIIDVDDVKVITKATPNQDDLKVYISGASQVNDNFSQIICESQDTSKNIQNPTLYGTTWSCGRESTPVE